MHTKREYLTAGMIFLVLIRKDNFNKRRLRLVHQRKMYTGGGEASHSRDAFSNFVFFLLNVTKQNAYQVHFTTFIHENKGLIQCRPPLSPLVATDHVREGGSPSRRRR